MLRFLTWHSRRHRRLCQRFSRRPWGRQIKEDGILGSVQQRVIKIMPWDHLFELSVPDVISGRFNARVAISNPNICVAFVANYNPWSTPSHTPSCLLLVVPTPKHTLVADGEPKTAAGIICGTRSAQEGAAQSAVVPRTNDLPLCGGQHGNASLKRKIICVSLVCCKLRSLRQHLIRQAQRTTKHPLRWAVARLFDRRIRGRVHHGTKPQLLRRL